MSPDRIRITIVTSTWNCAAALSATAASIRSQTHRAVQWIVADGASSDGTADRIRDNADVVNQWFSEPDTGIYDAWNKACRFIDGDWVLFLGAGDLLGCAETLERVVAELARMPSEVLVAYGNVVQIVAGEEIYRYGHVDLEQWELHRPKLPAHQGVFHRADTLMTPDPFDASYKVAADSKFLLQIVRPEVTRYMNFDITLMEPGGVSANPRDAITVMREVFRLEEDLGYQIPKSRRLLFVVRTYAKYLVFRFIGAGAVGQVIRTKRRLFGIRK